ncbi:MAG: DoxX family protein [Deltaproteobacteria bacterium]|nr:DoxX family protein [Deltaproteobacteria bacterium]
MKLPFQNTDLGLLTLRIAAGGFMLFSHGLGKLTHFSDIAPKFPDPLGVGHSFSLGLTVGAEFFMAGMVLLGVYTRWACVPLIITMAVAGLIIHGDDPFTKKELAFIYLSMYTTLFLTGGGKYTLDKSWRK